MRVNRPSTEALSQKEIKFLCDVCLYNLGSENKFYIKLAESFYLAQIKNKNIVNFYSMNIEAQQLDNEKFILEYKNLRLMYMLEGEECIWKQVDYIRSYVKKRNTKLFTGSLLDVKSEEMLNNVSHYLRVDRWKETLNSTFMPDCIAYINTIPVGTGEYIENLYSPDIKSNNEGEEFSTLVEDNRETIEKSTAEYLLYSSEFFVQTMKDIEAATATLFKDDSNDRSSLDMYYSSLINYLALKSLAKDYNYLKAKYENLTISAGYTTPYKFRKDSGGYGYRSYVSKDYRRQRLGNESNANDIFKRGVEAIRVLEDVVYKYRNKSNKELFLEGFHDFSERTSLPCGIIAYDGLLRGLFSVYAVEDLLNSIDLPLWAFPTIELRDKTWKRFSNYFELLNYYRVYEKLNTPLQATDRRLSLLNSNITNLKTSKVVTNESSTLEDILNNIRNIGLESIIKLKYNRGAREKTPSYIREESKLYSQVIENLTALTQDPDYLDFTKDKVYKSDVEFLLSLFNSLFLLLEEGVPNFITEDITFKRMYKQNVDLKELKKKIRIAKNLGEQSSIDNVLVTNILLDILSNAGNLDTLFNKTESNLQKVFEKEQNSFYNYKLLDNVFDGSYTWTMFLNTFNSALLYILLELKEDILLIIRDHAGLDNNNSYEKEGTRLLDCVVDMYKNPKLRAIVNSKDLNDFIRKYYILTVGDKYNISMNQIQAMRSIGNNEWSFASTMFNNIKSSLSSMISYVLDKNMSFDKAKDIKTSVFSLDTDYRNAAEIIHNHVLMFKGMDGLTEELQSEEYQNYLNIVKYMVVPDSCLIGRDGVPIKKYLSIKKHDNYYVFSVYGYKLLLPNGKEPVRMTIDDFKYVLSGGAEYGKLQ